MAKITLRNMFTKEQHTLILGRFLDNVTASEAYNVTAAYGEVPNFKELAEFAKTLGDAEQLVSRQLVRFWRQIFIDNGGSQAKAKREIVSERKLIQPSPSDDIGHTTVPKLAKRIMTIGDTHAPYTHPDALAFLESLKASYKPDVVVHMGDETDGHAISFHDSDPNLDSAGVELEKAKVWLEKLHDIFPELLVCDSNHGSLIYRRAKAHGLPVQFIKKYRDILFPEHGAPGWSWADAWVLETELGANASSTRYLATSCLTPHTKEQASFWATSTGALRFNMRQAVQHYTLVRTQAALLTESQWPLPTES